MRLNAQDVSSRLRTRLDHVGLDTSAEVVQGCAEYLLLLRRWNAKLNLAGFDLSEPSAAAIDRLLVEPLAAAQFARPEDRTTIDIGTGGGSPAVPFKLACPWLAATWFETRVRKASFLRETVRVLGLSDVDVRAEFGETANNDRADIVTVRAVRIDHTLGRSIARSLCENGRVLLFAPAPHSTVELDWRPVTLWPGGPAISIGSIESRTS